MFTSYITTCLVYVTFEAAQQSHEHQHLEASIILRVFYNTSDTYEDRHTCGWSHNTSSHFRVLRTSIFRIFCVIRVYISSLFETVARSTGKAWRNKYSSSSTQLFVLLVLCRCPCLPDQAGGPATGDGPPSQQMCCKR